MSFLASKVEKTGLTRDDGEFNLDEAAASEASPNMISTLGPNMIFTGNIVCDGPMRIFGRVEGDIHASYLAICSGAKVEGNVAAKNMIIQGAVKGVIRGNSIVLRGAAEVEGDIFHMTLAIEEHARFEGASRRLDKPVEPLSRPKVAGETEVVVSMFPSGGRAAADGE
jgi:cytoskeletal protein CcmA (bactofilin family)